MVNSLCVTDLLSLSPLLPLSVCLSVLLFLSHLAPDPLLVWVVKMGCSCGEGSYGALTERLFLPVTRTKTHIHAHTQSIRLKTQISHFEIAPFTYQFTHSMHLSTQWKRICFREPKEVHQLWFSGCIYSIMSQVELFECKTFFGPENKALKTSKTETN